MITTNNFKQILRSLGFTEHNNHFTKSFGSLIECVMEVNWNKSELIYPDPVKINDRTTCNFQNPENFVVFECVHRLLSKGYRPEHIELEKRWSLGHDSKGGKADICVYDETGQSMLFIIECKTYGKEYDRALKILKEDGGQLFSYWQQERSTKWISLYASDWKGDEIIYKNDIINCSDDANIVKMEEKDASVLLYKKATTVPEYFEAWTETYGQKIWQGLLFGNDTQAYKIGVRPLRKSDLKDFDPDDKIVNRFEEILRHNNVSDKENAFNRLVALFICKLVDEIKKQDNDVVEFQYRQGTDTYETLQDRLQRLHTEGMEEFMGEKIFYVSNDYAENLFKNYINHKREKAIEDLKNTIRILKFYSNNDFSFKDVHNEELFFQNGKILVEVVQLFENHKIVYPSKHQFLGDLFEQLLNKGFKQSEGQFFTPTPLTRFIWDSLPLAEIPKVIDYACGSGHFLTEAVESINSRLQTDENNTWVEKHIFGIEKDYRLARVSKISLFMNGAGSGNIIFGDGLENQPEKHIENNAFDILVANPPYSVSAFKSHLKLKNNSFELLNRISNDGSEIETLFVERIAQLLKPRGVAAVVLPSSILSNDSNSYTGAREILLKNFLIRSIVQFGSKTFGATGTNTVVLFLEKYNEPPKQSSLKHDSANAIIKNSIHTDDWEDGEILRSYLQKIEVSNEDYWKFTAEAVSFDGFADCEYLQMYADAFLKLTKTVNLQNSNAFKKLEPSDQSARLKQEFYSYAKQIEFEKLLYFALTYKQTVLIVTAPSDNAKQKRFLGYDWSNRKGAEGIQITQAGGMLYNDTDRNATSTIASAIRCRFNETTPPDLGEKQQYCTLANLSDLLDFSRVGFNKAIKLTPDKKIEIRSKYPLVKLGEIITIIRGVTFDKKYQEQSETKNIVLTADNITLDGHFEITKKIFVSESVSFDKEKLLKKDDCFMCFSSGSRQHVGKITFISEDQPYYAGGFMGILRVSDRRKLLPKFLYETLNNETMRDAVRSNSSGTNIQNLSNKITEFKIPLPPLVIQHQIVSECEKIDEEYNTSRMSIEEYKKKIVQVFENLEVITRAGGGKMMIINKLCDKINPSKSELPNFGDDILVSFVEMTSVSNDGYIEYKIDKPLSEMRKGSYTYFAEDDIIIAKITPCMENGKCAIATGLTNKIGFGSSEFHVLRCNEHVLNKYLFGYLNRATIRQMAEKRMTGASGHRRVPISFYENLEIPVLPISEQEKIVAEVSGYEVAIAKAQAVMASCADRKKAVLEKYLGRKQRD